MIMEKISKLYNSKIASCFIEYILISAFLYAVI